MLLEASRAEVDAYLKAHNESCNGKMDCLIARVALHLRSRDLRIQGQDVFDLQLHVLRSICAKVIDVVLVPLHTCGHAMAR
jgi:hypothetical protein